METSGAPFRHVLLLADERRPRVRTLVDYLRARTRVSVSANVATVLASECDAPVSDAPGDRVAPRLGGDSQLVPLVDLILLAPAIRDEFPDAEVDRLLDRFPLAFRLLLVDSWLEGETRSGRPWPGVARIYWDQFQPQWELAERGWLSEADARRSLAWRPATWTAEDAWLAPTHRDLPPSRGTILVCSERRESRETLEQVCAAAGWTVRSLSLNAWGSARVETLTDAVSEPIAAVIYDAPKNASAHHDQLRRLRQLHANARLVALIDFPRADEIEGLMQAGADSVLGRPYRIEDLLATLAMTTPEKTA